jgi:hypothetical protein
MLTDISPTEQRTWVPWEASLTWPPTYLLPKCSNIACHLVWQEQNGWKGRGRPWGLAVVAVWSLATVIPSFPQVPLRDMCQAMKIAAWAWF